MLKKLLLSLLLFTALLNATASTYENVTKLYVAMFDRAPDTCGLYYWVKESHLTLEEITISFFDQAETQSKYPSSLNNADFVKTVYLNLFNRTPAPDGLEYWVNELDSGNISRSIFILAVINGAQGTDAVILANKMEAGLYFATRGYCDQEAAISVMADVTDDPATVTSAISEIDNLAPDCGTVIDIQTGLMWQNDYSPRKTWPEAVDYCSNEVSLCDGTDWRLPTIEELKSIVDTGNTPTIISVFGGKCENAMYWSSSPDSEANKKAVICFWRGREGSAFTYEDRSVRCVRGK